MEEFWKELVWRQFGAAIDMLGNALGKCPDDLWQAHMWNDPSAKPEFSDFWYVAYHTLFWLDLYLSGDEQGFTPPMPFDLNELDPQGLLPGRVFTRRELQAYLAHCCQKCQAMIRSLTDERARQVCRFPWIKDGISFAELILDNMRHVQEHAAQLNMFLGQQAGINARWSAQVKDKPGDA